MIVGDDVAVRRDDHAAACAALHVLLKIGAVDRLLGRDLHDRGLDLRRDLGIGHAGVGRETRARNLCARNGCHRRGDRGLLHRRIDRRAAAPRQRCAERAAAGRNADDQEGNRKVAQDLVLFLRGLLLPFKMQDDRLACATFRFLRIVVFGIAKLIFSHDFDLAFRLCLQYTPPL